MPGRSSRSSAAAVPRKSGSGTVRSRASAAHHEIPDEGPVTHLRQRVCQIFADAQHSTATQRKLVVNLRKIQEACCWEQPAAKGQVHEFADFDEGDFNQEVGRCVARVLTIKKGETVGDRLVRFLGVFLKRANEEDNAHSEDATSVPETPSSRLTTHILHILLNLVGNKDKTVRFRATQTITHIISCLTHIDDDLYNHIRVTLSRRMRDKESYVRVQAVLGFGQLVGDNDDEDDDDDDSDDESRGNVVNKLLDIMQNDPTPEVRRAVLLNLPFRPNTLRFMLERARDQDPVTRRALYGKLLPALNDFRHMSLIEREKLIRWGLRDRDDLVRKAAARLFSERWVESIATTSTQDSEVLAERKPGEVSPPSMGVLLELLERIEITRSGIEGGIAHDAMREFWDNRPDYREHIQFEPKFWTDLTAEGAFVARTLHDYMRASDNPRLQEKLEGKFLELTGLAHVIQNELNELVRCRQNISTEDATAEDEEEYTAKEFIVEQLLHIILKYDFSDETGRRQIFNLMRESLARTELPEDCTRLAVSILSIVSSGGIAGEKDFVRIVNEAISEIKDTLTPDDTTIKDDDDDDDDDAASFVSAPSEINELSSVKFKAPVSKQAKKEDQENDEDRAFNEILVYAKCLHITECMLGHVYGELEKNLELVSLLNTLIVPAVQNRNAMIRELGIKCLGLACVLSKNLAISNLQLFLICYSQGHEDLQIIAIQVLADVINAHPSLLAPPPTDDTTDAEAKPKSFLKQATKTFLKAFNSGGALSQVACQAISQLLLRGNVLPPAAAAEFLKALTIAYFNPETASDDALRQALTYCIPVFCHSRPKNALLMSHVAIQIMQKLAIIRDQLDEDEADEMVGWSLIANHMAEWTDGRRCVKLPGVSDDGGDDEEESHISLATDILERVMTHSCGRDERKPLLTLLTKLHVSPTATEKKDGSRADEDTLRTLHALAAEAVEAKIGSDATTRNFIVKLESGLTKRLGDVESATQVQDATTAAEEEAEAEARQNEDDVTAQVEEEVEEVTAQLEETVLEDTVMEDADDDTMLAGVHAEGTRMPLEDEDDEEEEEIDDSEGTVVGTRNQGQARSSRATITESDIIDSLLDSEVEFS